MVELAVLRGCTSRPDSWVGVDNINPDSENREGGVGWPGMMSIRVHELDGMYDHPILPMAGEPWQLLEIQCHSKLAAKRFQKPKKGSKNDGSDDNGDAVVTTDVRLNSESPLMWIRADPEMEYLAEVHFNQPVQMWINQLEKDKDVVAQAQAISVLEALPQLSFSVVNALNNFLSDSKAFWRVRIQAAFALATTTCEDTDWTGLLHLINFYKSRRFDPNIGLPRSLAKLVGYGISDADDNRAIPHAVAMVRSSDKKSPREAVEFILQLLKSVSAANLVWPCLLIFKGLCWEHVLDVFWVAALVQSVGELEFGQQSIIYLPSLLKRLDRLLQFDRLMPSHNGILTISCIQSLTRMALKLSEFIPLDRIIELIKPYRTSKTWQIRVAASRALLELEFQCKGTDAALILFIRYLNNESSLRGQTKLCVCALRLSQMTSQSDCDNDVKSDTLVTLLRLLESPLAFNNVILRHYIFCILQVLARRVPTLYGVPRDETLRTGHTKNSELKNIFAALINQSKTPDPSCAPDLPHNMVAPEGYPELDGNHDSTKAENAPAPDYDAPEQRNSVSDHTEEDPITMPNLQMPAEIQQPIEQVTNSLGDTNVDAEAPRKAGTLFTFHQETEPVFDHAHDNLATMEAPNEPDTVSNSREVKKPKIKIRVKQSLATSRAEDPDNVRISNTLAADRGGASSRAEDPDNARISNTLAADRGGASSSVSVDAPNRNFAETISTGNHNFEDVNSCQDVGSRVTASIGSAKPTIDGEEFVKELQCTADSSKVSLPVSTSTMKIDMGPQTSERDLASPSVGRDDVEGSSRRPTDTHSHGKKEKKKKKDKDKKRKKNGHDDDPERLELKRRKKEKKRKEKEMAKLLADKTNAVPSVELPGGETRVGGVESGGKEHLPETRQDTVAGLRPEPSEANVNRTDRSVSAPTPSAPSHKIKIKFKNRTLGKQ
ncbi:hypothetical protein DH2020_026372 [Rehmannia glutinosa]|uniref:Transcription initiation factor TFIID subunit 2 n=1 Tax=Rehmannia glutinosa TaxID=99300 RepID=A0ABR0VX95_REHGL